MRRPERIVFALAAPGEAGQPAALAQGPDPVAPAGEDLVGIALVADIPDQNVLGGVEHRMQRDGEFDDAETRAEMTSGLRHRGDGFVPELVADLPETVDLHAPEIRRAAQGIKQGGSAGRHPVFPTRQHPSHPPIRR